MIVHPLPGREQTGEALYHREAVDALCSWLSVLQSNMENLPHDRSRWFASDPESATASVPTYVSVAHKTTKLQTQLS